MLTLGTQAPDFTLKDQNNADFSLSDLKGKWVVLYFYPKALTPGCIVQAEGMSAIKDDLGKLNAVSVGISADAPEKLKKFEEKKGLNFTLAGDLSEDKALLKAYQAWGEKKFMGKVFDGIYRITYIIDPNGKIAHTMPEVKTKTHHEDVLAWLKENAQ